MLAEDSVSQQEADEKKSDLLAKRATAEAMRANVRRLETLVSFKRLVAPFDGIVTARKTDVGALIQAGGGNDPELFTVSDVRQLRVYVSVPQINAAAIKAGLSASLTVPERPGMTFAAKLVDTDHAITPASGTLLVQLIVDNRSGLLLPGEYTEVHFTLPVSANTLRVPASTLIFQKNGLQIAVVGKDNRVQLKPITIGTDLGSQVEIATGLQPNDRVVDNPPDSLAPGDLVQVAANSVANSSKIALSRRVRT
jgi:RND family efflux transporter MFP subunit